MGTNFQSTTQPRQVAGRGDPALPASAPDPDLEGAPGPKNPLPRPPPAHRATSRNTEGASGSRLQQPAHRRCPARPPVHRLAGDMGSCRAIRALQKGTHLLLRKTPFCTTCPATFSSSSLPPPPERLSPPLPPRRPGELHPLSLNPLELTATS